MTQDRFVRGGSLPVGRPPSCSHSPSPGCSWFPPWWPKYLFWSSLLPRLGRVSLRGPCSDLLHLLVLGDLQSDASGHSFTHPYRVDADLGQRDAVLGRGQHFRVGLARSILQRDRYRRCSRYMWEGQLVSPSSHVLQSSLWGFPRALRLCSGSSHLSSLGRWNVWNSRLHPSRGLIGDDLLFSSSFDILEAFLHQLGQRGAYLLLAFHLAFDHGETRCLAALLCRGARSQRFQSTSFSASNAAMRPSIIAKAPGAGTILLTIPVAPAAQWTSPLLSASSRVCPWSCGMSRQPWSPQKPDGAIPLLCPP